MRPGEMHMCSEFLSGQAPHPPASAAGEWAGQKILSTLSAVGRVEGNGRSEPCSSFPGPGRLCFSNGVSCKVMSPPEVRTIS